MTDSERTRMKKIDRLADRIEIAEINLDILLWLMEETSNMIEKYKYKVRYNKLVIYKDKLENELTELLTNG